MPEYIPLAFGLEMLYPPMALPSGPLRDAYAQLADPCRFAEFRNLGEGMGARLAENNNRFLTVGPDRFVYRDEFSQSTYSTFEEDIHQILTVLRQVFHVPVFLHSTVLVRLLMPYSGSENTVEFFQRTVVCGAVPYLDQFERPASGIGLRLVFPPSPELHSTFHLRIEPYFRDIKMFFLENSAQFFDPVLNIEDAKNHLNQAYSFVKEKAGPFVLSLSSP